ncbi:PIN domain-like protein [Ramaria rubella]|nr:PIN domain-like protein [Ramaria rubella]
MVLPGHSSSGAVDYYQCLCSLYSFSMDQNAKQKRGKTVRANEHWIIDNLKQILEAFGFNYRMAHGEAEAELAYLNTSGDINAVWSDNIDCFLFGAVTVMHNTPAALSKRDVKKERQFMEVYSSKDIAENGDIGLTQGGLILIALLCGGDYDMVHISTYLFKLILISFFAH